MMFARAYVADAEYRMEIICLAQRTLTDAHTPVAKQNVLMQSIQLFFNCFEESHLEYVG